MKNQYSFLKTIDASNSSGSNQEVSNKKSSMKNSLSKLQNLVASKFSQEQQTQASIADRNKKPSQQQQQQQRDARMFSLSANTAATRQQVPQLQDMKAATKSSEKQQAELAHYKTTTPASKTHQPVAPEIAKCYDEIDQIYDYIRGLAPLPAQLRKIKSIDFEQMERDKRLREIAMKSKQVVVPTVNLARSTKVRQRDGSSDGASEKLRDPKSDATAKIELQQGIIRGPIKVTATTSDEMKPEVKRVENFKISCNLDEATQRAQLFRLPRANSTSNLNRATSAKNHSAISVTKTNGQKQQPVLPETTTTRTLPALRLSRVSIFDQLNPLTSLAGRSRTKLVEVNEEKTNETSPTRRNLSHKEPVDLDRERDATSSSQSDSSSSRVSPSDESNSDSSQTETSNSRSSGSSSSSSSSVANKEIHGFKSRERRETDRWAEKSHSDYENETVSMSGSSKSSSGQIDDHLAAKNREDQQQTSRSHQTSNVTLDRKQDLHDDGKVEHIYEQIPAHKTSSKASRQPQVVDRYDDNRARQQMIQRNSGYFKPYNYPIAYAPNVANSSKSHYGQKAIGTRNQRANVILHNNNHPAMRYSTGNTYPVTLTSSRPIQFQAAIRPFNQRRQLSVNNLHLLPYLGQPFSRSSNFYPVADHTASLNRSSSSNRINKIVRAPRLSPTQLIAQIQVPRAMSKRQYQRDPEATSGFTVSAGGQANATGRDKQPVVLNCLRQDRAQVGGRNLQPTATSRRNQPRRLTAIGIEEALDCVRQASSRYNGVPTDNNSLEKRCFVGNRISTSRQLEDFDQNNKKNRQQGGFFEPPQLVRAPLIDDDDPVTTSSASDNEPSNGVLTSHSGDKQSLVKPQARLSINGQCLNSISDLHSLASSSSEDHEDQQVTDNEESIGVDGVKQVDCRSSRKDDNFVSSRSFIKCYYGREKEEDEQPVGGRRQNEPNEVTKEIKKKKLFNLIGLNTSKQRVLSSKGRSHKSETVSHQANHRLPGSLGSEMRPNSQRRDGGSSVLVGEFLNAEGPILVRDKRIAPVKHELVRHYEHPIVKVASVSNFRDSHREPDRKSFELLQKRATALQKGSTDTTNSTSSYEAAIRNSRKQSKLLMDEQARREEILSKESQQVEVRTNKKSSSGNKAPTSQQAALIKVPKLSKQSHLLNRPLPKPPSSNRLTVGHLLRSPSVQHGQQQQLNPQDRLQVKPSVSSYRKPLTATNANQVDPPNRLTVKQPRATRNVSGQQKELPQQQQQHTSASNISSQLSPFAIATNPHSSPTVTTCTSSGISSRLTNGTHLASSVSSGRFRSLSELNKQSRGKHSTLETSGSSGGRGETDSPSTRHQRRSDDSFALMDDSSETEEAENNPTASEGRLHQHQHQHQQQQPTNRETVNLGNLRLFDEKFSAKFKDQQLASSNDSLLESIDFSNTLNRRLTVAAKR